MKTLLKTAALALAFSTAPLAYTAPASAQAIKGLGVVDGNQAVRDSAAFKNAQTARQTTYAAQIAQATTERTTVSNQLNGMVTKFNADRAKPNANQQELQGQLQQMQQIENNSNQKIQQILQPVALSEAYVIEQIGDKFDEALKAAMARTKTSIVLDMRTTVSFDQPSDLTDEVTVEINRLLPNAQLVPPAGWLPRAQREQQAAQGGQQPAAPTTPAPAQPNGR